MGTLSDSIWMYQTLAAIARLALDDPEVVEAYLAELYPDASGFDPLLVRWKQRPDATTGEAWLRELFSDATLAPLLRDLVLAVLFGSPYVKGTAAAAASPNAYFQGRYWHYTATHVTGLTNAYFGHWAYPPEGRA